MIWVPGFHASWVICLAALPFIVAGLWHHHRGRRVIGAVFVLGGSAALLIGAVAGLLIARNPLFDGSEVWGWTWINRLTVGYAAACAAAWLAANFLSETRPGLSRLFGLVAVALSAILVISQVRMLFHGAPLTGRGSIGLAEAGVYVLWLTTIAGVVHIASDSASVMRWKVELVANFCALAVVGLFCVWRANPLVGAGMATAGLFDSSYVGLLLPAIGFGFLALLGHIYPIDARRNLRTVNLVAATVLGWLFLVVQVRRGFVGADQIAQAGIGLPELITLAAVTVAYGATIGLALRPSGGSRSEAVARP